MEGKSAPPDMIPMSRSSRDYRASKNPKVSSEDASSGSKKSQIRVSGSPTRSSPATKKSKIGGVTLAEQNRLAHALETSSGRSEPLRPVSSRSKRAADSNADVTLEALRPPKKSKISGESTTSKDNDSLLSRKNLKSESTRKKLSSGAANPASETTPEVTPSNNALKLGKSGAGSAGSSSHSEEINVVGGSVPQISEGVSNVAGSSEPPELTEQRSLRPRPKPPALKKVVKRTRFHEVSLGDSDGPRIVGRRIKVFWPLDKKWYYGSVKAYNGSKKQHKIIYDDHDEEWLRLQKESFRLEVLTGDVFGDAAPASTLLPSTVYAADYLSTIDEGDVSHKHRGDAADGSASASEDKQGVDESTGLRRSKVGRENERKRKAEESDRNRKVEGTSEMKKKLDGSGHCKKGERGNEQKKKLEGDGDSKKKAEGATERGRKTEARRDLRKRGDVKQRSTKGEKLGRGNAKRAVLEVYERRKKRAQAVATSGASERRGKGLGDGPSDRRKWTGKESSRKASNLQPRTRHSAPEATDGKKPRRGIRDNDRLFASIKTSAVIRRKVAESKRSKELKRVDSTAVPVVSVEHAAPEDEEKVFPSPDAVESGPGYFKSYPEEKIGDSDRVSDPPQFGWSKRETECDNEQEVVSGSPVTSTADVTDEENATCEGADSSVCVNQKASDDEAMTEGCTLVGAEDLLSVENAVRGDASQGACAILPAELRDNVAGELPDGAKGPSCSAVCPDQLQEEFQTGNDADSCLLEAADLVIDCQPEVAEVSAIQEVLRSPFPPVTSPLSELKHPPDKVYRRVRNKKIYKVYRRETQQSNSVHKHGVVQDEGLLANAPVVEQVVVQLSALSCVISAPHVFLDGARYFALGVTGMASLGPVLIPRLGGWSRLRGDTLQLGTYFGVPGIESLLRVSRKFLQFFVTTSTESKLVAGFSSGAAENNSASSASGTCLGEVIELHTYAGLISRPSFTRPGWMSKRTVRPGPLRRRSYNVRRVPYLIDPLWDAKRLSVHSVHAKQRRVATRRRPIIDSLRCPNSCKIERRVEIEPTSALSSVQESPSHTREVDGWAPSSGADLVPTGGWVILPSQFRQQLRSFSHELFSKRRGPTVNLLIDTALGASSRGRTMVKLPVASVLGESSWHDPQGWTCREVGPYYGRRSLKSLLRVSVDDDLWILSCSSDPSLPEVYLRSILKAVTEIYEECRAVNFELSRLSPSRRRDFKVLVGKVEGLHSSTSQAAGILSRLCRDISPSLRDLADHWSDDLSQRRLKGGLPGFEIDTFTNSSDLEHPVGATIHPSEFDGEKESCHGKQMRCLNVLDEASCSAVTSHTRQDTDDSQASSNRVSGPESPPVASALLHHLVARWSIGWVPRSLAVQGVSMCSSAFSKCIREPCLPLPTPDYRANSWEVSAVEGTALSTEWGSISQGPPSVLVVRDKGSFRATRPVLFITCGSRYFPEVYSKISSKSTSQIGTYYGPPSVESFLRISKDFWKELFPKQPEFQEAEKQYEVYEAGDTLSPTSVSTAMPVVIEGAHAVSSHCPELASVETQDDGESSDTEDLTHVTFGDGPGVNHFGGEGRKKGYGEQEFGSTGTPGASLAPPVKGRRTGKGLKRGLSHTAADVCDTNGGEVETLSGGDGGLNGRPYSKRTRAEIESSSAAVVRDNMDASSPSSDVDGSAFAAPSPIPEQKPDESLIPRVNVLKLRRCPTNKGLWRVAGNSCTVSQERSTPGRGFEARDSGEGAEPMTPGFETSRKRSLDKFTESPHLARNNHVGNSILTSSFFSSPTSLDQDVIGVSGNKAGSLIAKSRDSWFDCGMASINDSVPDGLEPRKRRRKGPSPPTQGEDVDALTEHPVRRASDNSWGACSANVLITKTDRCLRETGAAVEIQSGHGNSWMLTVSLHGERKFAYKADQPVATGTSNKFTHAMIWRGGKDWSLEFVDRKQWQLFKDLHEECFQRSVRAATMRHIPIPGVQQIQELQKPGVRFVRPASKYIHQYDGEVETALTSSRIIYDMDSEDEEWLNEVNNEKVSSRGSRSRPRIEEDTLEKVMDKLEKASFVRPHQDPLLTSEVAAEICQALGSQEAVKAIHGYWYDKRHRKGMALVRHFQPAPWEQYQKLLEDWQQNVNQLQQQSPTASKQQLQSLCKRPPLFAFCLRPRGLENRNKMQKQRSQRKQGLGGSSSRQWTLAGPASDFFLDSPSKRPVQFENSSGPFYGTRKYGRQRLSEDNYSESMAVDLTESFNAIASGEGFTSSGGAEQVIPSRGGVSFSQVESSSLLRTERTVTTRPHNKKKAGRKARKMRLLASAEESRRKRQLRAQQGHVKERFLDAVHSPQAPSQFGLPPADTPSTSSLSFLQGSEDLDLEAVAIAKAAAAKVAREAATAKRARAQALYAVADAAMHKAVAAVIAADAIHASERAMEKAAMMLGRDVESPEQTGEAPVKDEGSKTRLRTPVMEGGPSFGSWRRALNSASRNANHVLSKGTSSKQGLMPDTDDPLLPVASWSQELGAGLGTRLLQTGEVSPQRQRYSPVLEGLAKSPSRGVVSLGRTRGESMMAMLTR